jgi:hypothetical protein
LLEAVLFKNGRFAEDPLLTARLANELVNRGHAVVISAEKLDFFGIFKGIGTWSGVNVGQASCLPEIVYGRLEACPTGLLLGSE